MAAYITEARDLSYHNARVNEVNTARRTDMPATYAPEFIDKLLSPNKQSNHVRQIREKEQGSSL